MLLELCELGDRTTLDALCGDQVDAGLSDVSPISLLLFLLRQGLSFDDKKACCAVGTLLMCLAANNRYAAGLILRLNGLPELSTVMTKYPSELGIQKYSASASKEIALSSIQKPSPARRVKETASEILQESGSLEELHHERFRQANGNNARYTGDNTNASRPNAGGRSRTPGGTGKRKTAPMASYPSPTRGQPALSYKDPLSFSKFASPIGKAPYLPANMTSFTANSSQQQRNSLVILDGGGHHGSEQMLASTTTTKQFVKEERQSLLFETYGVQGGNIAKENPGTTRGQGIKRKQLKTRLVSAAEPTWATPVVSPKKLLRDDMLSNPGSSYSSGQPFSSRSDIIGMGSYAPGSQRSYEDGEPMMDDEASDRYQFYSQQQQPTSYRASDLSPTSGHASQQHQQAATKKKKKKTSASVNHESFQIKIESETQLRISKETRSPFVSPISPSHKRTKASSLTGPKVGSGRSSNAHRVSSHGVQRVSGSCAMKKPQLRQDTESLNAYATKLFNEDFGLDGDGANDISADFMRNNTLSAREQAEIQERERLSFAEKLHKMIDKAKSTLAVSNITSSSEPISQSSRSTASSKSSNGSKMSTSRPPTEAPASHGAPVDERPTAPAVKKTRVPSSDTTPRKTARETSAAASESSVASIPSELMTTSSQPKSQSIEPKKYISGSKISSLSTPKRPVAALPAASAKSTSTATATTRANKLEPGRPVQTPKSALKANAGASSSSKAVKPTTPATVVKASKDGRGRGENTAMVNQEASHDDTVAVALAEEPAAITESSAGLSSEAEAQAAADETVNVAEKDDLDIVLSCLPDESEQQAESPAVDENAVAKSEDPAESHEATVASLESELAPEQETPATIIANEEDAVSTVVDESPREEGSAPVETTNAPASTEAPPEAVDPASPDSEAPTTTEALSISETEDVQPVAAVVEDINVDVPVAAESSCSDTVPDAASPRPVDAAPVDDIYADEYNEFDFDDGAGDEAAAEALDEQIADDADGHLSGKASLDDLLSMADQVTEVPQPPAEPELPAGAEEIEAADPEPPVPSHEDDSQPTDGDTEKKTLSSSKSSDNLYADEVTAGFEEIRFGSSTARVAPGAKGATEQAVVGDGFDAVTAGSDEIVPEPQTEEDPTSLPVAELSGEGVATAANVDESTLATLLKTSEQSSSDSGEQESTEVVVAPEAESVNNTEDSDIVPSPAEVVEETKDSEVAARDSNATLPSEIQVKSSHEADEASAADEATLSPDVETNASETVPISNEIVAAEEAEVVDERPVSRGADSYAEDGFDFEPDEEGGDAAAAESPAPAEVTQDEDAADQKDAERSESDVVIPQPVAEAVEPPELPQESVTNPAPAALADGMVEPVESGEFEEAIVGSEDNIAPDVEIEPPSASEEADGAAEAEQIEKPSPAAVPDSPDAGYTAQRDDAEQSTEAAPVSNEATQTVAAAAAEAEARDDADEYDEDYGDADFEEAVESGVQGDTGDASAPPGVDADAGCVDSARGGNSKQHEDVLAASSADTGGDASAVEPTRDSEVPKTSDPETVSSATVFNDASGEPSDPVMPTPFDEAPCESTRDGDEQLPVEPALVDVSSDEQADGTVQVLMEVTSETAEPLVDEPVASVDVDAVTNSQNGDGEDVTATRDSEPVVECAASISESQQDVEIGGDAAAAAVESGESEAQVDVTAEVVTEAATEGLDAEQGYADRYSESYGDEFELVEEEAGDTPKAKPIETTTELAPDMESFSPNEVSNAGTNETKESDQELAGKAVPASAQTDTEQADAGDQASLHEERESPTELEPPAATEAEQAEDVPVSADVQATSVGGDTSPVDEPLYEDDSSGDATDPAEEDAVSAAPSEVESAEQQSVPDAVVNEEEERSNGTADSERDTSATGESGVQGDDDLAGQDLVTKSTTEPESIPSTADDALPEVEDQPVDNTERIVIDDDVDEDLKLDTPLIASVDTIETEASSSVEAPEAVPVVPKELQEPADADEGYEDDGDFEEGGVSQDTPGADETQTAEPMAADPESSAVDEEVADQQKASEEASSADGEQQEDEPTRGAFVAATAGPGDVDESAAVEAPSSTNAALDDESDANAAPEDEDSKFAAGKPAVENAEEEVNQQVERATDATTETAETESSGEGVEVVSDSGEEAQPSKPAPAESEETQTGVEGTGGDGSTEPETLDARPIELNEKDESARKEPQATDEGVSIGSDNEAQSLSKEAVSEQQQLSTESEAQQSSSSEFASYDDFADQGDEDSLPSPVSEPAPSVETDVAENVVTTAELSPQVVNDAESDASVVQESEPTVVSVDAGDEMETKKEPSDDKVLLAPTEPEATSPESIEATSLSADQDSEAQHEDSSTKPLAASVDADTTEDQSSSEAAVKSAKVTHETVISDASVPEAEQVSSEEPPSGDVAVPDSELAPPSESDTDGDAAATAHSPHQQSEANSVPESDEVVLEEAAAVDEAIIEESFVHVDSVSDSEPSEPEASQPSGGDADDGAESEPEQTEAAAAAMPADEPPSPPQEPADKQQPEVDEAESPTADQYDEFEAEAEAAVVEITAVEDSPPAPDSADAYDDFEEEAEPVVLQVQPVSDTTTPAVGSELPSSDLYDDFEGNDDEASPVAAPSESPEEKTAESTEKPTAAAAEDENDEYAEEVEYNDFEEDDEKPSSPPAAVQPVGVNSSTLLSTESSPREVEDDDDDVEPQPLATITSSAKEEPKEADEPSVDYDDADYAVEEEEFESNEKPSAASIEPPKPAAPVPATAPEERPAAQEDAENEADYDAEYDDFED